MGPAIRTIAFLAILLGACSCAPSFERSHTVELGDVNPYRVAARSVVMIYGSVNGNVIGAGFAFDKDHIITASHVASIASTSEIGFSVFGDVDDELYVGRVIADDETLDVAIIHAPEHGIKPIKVALKCNIGDRVWVIGHPRRQLYSLSTGVISNFRDWPAPRIQTDTPVNLGNSGGVMVNRVGRLIGMPVEILGFIPQNTGISFAVPGDEIATFFKDNT